MSYNPIFMEDDGGASFAGDTWCQNGVEANMDLEEQRTTALVAGVSIIHPSMTSGEVIRRCQKQYHFEFSWRVAFPQLPAAPLLYFPEAIKQLLRDPAPLGVMQAELNAMSEDVLQRIPLAYYPFCPEVLEETRKIAMEREERVKDMQRQAAINGLPEILTWKPEEVNPYLEPADAKLLDTDIDSDLVLERDKPSLTLLQRPLYTDMGLVPQEQRHLERLARIVPESLRTQTLLSSSQDSEARGLTQTGLQNGQLGTETSQEWLDGVQKSFRHARTIDSHYEKMLKTVAETKLGLDCNDSAAMRLTRDFWHLLFEGAHKNQQRDVWHQLCRFSYNYDGSREASEELERVLTALELPQSHLWLTLVREYIDLLKKHTLTFWGGAERRKKKLRISEKDLGSSQQGTFAPDLQPGPALRRVGKEMGADRQPVPIFPVEVVPLYPTDFDKTAAAMAAGDHDRVERLGELAMTLHHVLLPGAVVSDESRMGGPHVLVNNSELLVADTRGATQLSDGMTVSYHASRENTFEPLVEDTNNRSSYLFQLCSVQGDSVPTGLANANGRYVVYNRLRVQNLFVKAPNAETPPHERYVLMFDTEGKRKRPREVYDEAEERYALMRRTE